MRLRLECVDEFYVNYELVLLCNVDRPIGFEAVAVCAESVKSFSRLMYTIKKTSIRAKIHLHNIGILIPGDSALVLYSFSSQFLVLYNIIFL